MKVRYLKPILAIVATASLTMMVSALPSFYTAFSKNYDLKDGSHLQKAKCLICHATAKGGKALNPYGKDVQKELKAEHLHKVTDAVLKAVEPLDSAGTGSTNIKRIKADQLPGGN